MRTKDIERTLALIAAPHDEDLQADLNSGLDADIKRIMDPLDTEATAPMQPPAESFVITGVEVRT